MEEGPHSTSGSGCVGSHGDVLGANAVVLPRCILFDCVPGASCEWLGGFLWGAMLVDTEVLGVLLWQCIPALKGRHKLDIS